MKNKERYDLTRLTIKPYYQSGGCGKKIEGKCRIDVIYEDKVVVLKEETKEAPVRFLLNRLEKEN